MEKEGTIYDLVEAVCAVLGEPVRGGYGIEYENEVFMMHPYCWCEQDECKWCGGDASPFSVHSGYFTNGPQNEEAGLAPNFHFKPTDYKLWWYKYIGRGEQNSGTLPTDWYAQCIASLPTIKSTKRRRKV